MTAAPCIALLLAISAIPAMAQAPCKATQLSAGEDRDKSHEIDGGLGHQAMTIVIQNRSASSCFLDGAPSVQLLAHAGPELLATACANCGDYLFSPQPVAKIVLDPKRSAYLVLGYLTECRGSIPLGFQLSDQRAGLRLAIRGLASCRGLDVTPFLENPPLEGFLPTFEPAVTPR